MTIASEYLQPEAEDTLAHPRIRAWKQALGEAGGSGFVETHQPRRVLAAEPAVLYVTIGKSQDREPWSDEIHRGLVDLGLRGKTEQDDSLRFALALRSAFEPIEVDVGEGYFNSVLVDHLHHSTIAAELADVLARVHVPRPSPGQTMANTNERIRSAIRAQGRDLLTIGWSPVEASRVLVQAIRRYLDDRFYLSAREALGWG